MILVVLKYYIFNELIHILTVWLYTFMFGRYNISVALSLGYESESPLELKIYFLTYKFSKLNLLKLKSDVLYDSVISFWAYY